MSSTVLIAAAVVMVLLAQRPALQPASLSGFIVDAVTGQPLRHAMATIRETADDSSRATRNMLTDAGGRFVFNALRPGPYDLRASSASFFTQPYGPFGGELELRPGERLENVRLALVQSSEISGRVTDDRGQPVADVEIAIAHRVVVGGVEYLQPRDTPTAKTDADGRYRADWLRPGQYLVGLQNRVPPRDPSIVHPSIFYPNTVRAEDAETIELAAGEMRTGIDMRVESRPARRVAGRLIGPAGSIRWAAVRLFQARAREMPVNNPLNRSAVVSADNDGAFTIDRIAPGRYVLVAASIDVTRLTAVPFRPIPELPSPRMWQRVDVDVTERDATGLEVALQPLPPIRGRLVFARPGDRLRLPPEGVGITLVPVSDGTVQPDVRAATVPASADSFTIEAVQPGRYWLLVRSEDAGWSATFGAEDVTRSALVIGSGETRELTVTVGGPTANLYGQIADRAAAADPNRNLVAVVFVADRVRWSIGMPTGHVQVVPIVDGRFRATVPAGDYFVVAVDAEAFRSGGLARQFPWFAPASYLVAVGADTVGNLLIRCTPREDLLALWARTAIRVTASPGTRTGVDVSLRHVVASASRAVAQALPPPTEPRTRPTGASIEGRVLDSSGAPVSGITVMAVMWPAPSSGMFSTAGEGGTDRWGRYAIDGLRPGSYVIGTPFWPTQGDVRILEGGLESRVAWPDAFHTSDGRAPQPVVLNGSEVRTGIDLIRRLAPASAVSGQVTSSTGIPLSRVFASMRGPAGRLVAQARAQDVFSSPEYRFDGLIAGRYAVDLRASERAAGPDSPETTRVHWGRVEFETDGVHPADAPARLRPGAVLTMRVVFDAGPPYDHWPNLVSPERVESGSEGSYYSWQVPRLQRSDTLTWNGLPAGTFQFRVSGYRVTLMRGGQLLPEAAISLSLGDEVRDVVMTLVRTR